MNMPVRARGRGVTLLELMIVIVILGIIVGIAVPSYRNYVLRSHRTDATALLLKVRAAQEKFFMQRDRYAIGAELTQAPPAGLGYPQGSSSAVAVTENGFFEVGTAPGAVATSFVLTARAIGRQLDDGDCRTFTLNDQGQRQAFDANDADTTATCWR